MTDHTVTEDRSLPLVEQGYRRRFRPIAPRYEKAAAVRVEAVDQGPSAVHQRALLADRIPVRTAAQEKAARAVNLDRGLPQRRAGVLPAGVHGARSDAQRIRASSRRERTPSFA
jgi:hypothetical protein